MKIVWQIQKNSKNGQPILLGADPKVPLLCLVRNWMMLVEQAQHLGQAPDMPVCIYPNRKKEFLNWYQGRFLVERYCIGSLSDHSAGGSDSVLRSLTSSLGLRRA